MAKPEPKVVETSGFLPGPAPPVRIGGGGMLPFVAVGWITAVVAVVLVFVLS